MILKPRFGIEILLELHLKQRYLLKSNINFKKKL
jgi:hypothetical protein